MTPSEMYRAKAAECEARAKADANPLTRAEWQYFARAYRRLAEQADRNATLDLTYETPARHSNERSGDDSSAT